MKSKHIKTASFKKSIAIAILCAFVTALLAFAPLLRSGGKAVRASAEIVTAEHNGSGQPQVHQSAAYETLTLTVNYYRTDGKYDDWDLWVWLMGSEGRGVEFEDTVIADKKWRTLTIEFKDVVADSSNNVIGVIPRRGGSDWAEQTSDILLDTSMIVDNKITIYLVDKESTVYMSAEEVLAKKIASARLTDFKTVVITTTAPITNKSKFKIKDASGTVYTVADGEAAKGTRSLTLKFADDFELDFTETYTVYDEPDGEFDDEVNFTSCVLGKSSLFDTAEFDAKFGFDGALGAEYSKEKTVFTVWAPTASSLKLNIYNAGSGTETPAVYDMVKGEKGSWSYTATGNLAGKYYTYTVHNGGKTSEVVDPYARSAGTNGKRGMILDLDSTDPEGWNDATQHKIPDYGTTANAVSKAVIYEAQLRDLTINANSGVSEANRGKFLGLTETGTKNAKGSSTALDYIKALGVTQIHFQPLFDFATVDESFTTATYDKAGEYNWGYDPLNYNVPEGSYSSNPADGAVRVKEMKEMIMALHNAGIQVIMDVVYNHVSSAQTSNFQALLPDYYFRTNATGGFYNGSGCGNETASERFMFNKFMRESVKYWMEEYKLDGFRFDLMALHDIDTMNTIYDELATINPDVIVYGEGWTGGTSGLSSISQASQGNSYKLPNIAMFNDIIRDGLKGSVFDSASRGFVSGVIGNEAAVYVGAAGATNVLVGSKYATLGASSFAANPTQSINYVSAHDNSALWDKLHASADADEATLKAFNRLAATSVLTSQGASFFLAGEEMLRSKPTTEENDYDNRPIKYLGSDYYFSDNSYKSPDSVNAINWELVDTNADMIEFYKGLIEIKKTFPQFAIATRSALKSNIVFCDSNYDDGVAVYAVKDPGSNKYAVLVYNTKANGVKVNVPQGAYDVFVNGDKASGTKLSSFNGSSVSVGAYSAMLMVAELDQAAVKEWKPVAENTADSSGGPGCGGCGGVVGAGGAIAAALATLGGAALALRKKKEDDK